MSSILSRGCRLSFFWGLQMRSLIRLSPIGCFMPSSHHFGCHFEKINSPMTLHDPHSASTLKLSVRKKRKGSTAFVPDASSSKRRRHQAPATSSASSGPSKSRVIRRGLPLKSVSSSDLGIQNLERKARDSTTANELPLFSRSVQSLAPYTRSHKVSQISNVTKDQEEESALDLTAVKHVGTLEMVEGDAILQTLLGERTPRMKRRFPSEEALTESERKDREALRRRRLKLQSQFSVLKEENVSHNNERVADTGLWPAESTGDGQIVLEKPQEREKTSQSGKKNAVKDEKRVHEVDEDVETDEETTESKIQRVSQAMHLNWRQWTLWLVSGALLLCFIVIAAPFVKKVWKPPLPYCDSKWVEATDGSFVLAEPVDHFDRSKALQPFVSFDAKVLEPVCQPCPVYGNCLNGSVLSCASSYDLQHGICKENPEIQRQVDQLALRIQHFVIDQAAKNVCETVSLWNYIKPTIGTKNAPEKTPRAIYVSLSEMHDFVTEIVSFGSKISREYLFYRALDMALRKLKTIFVTEDQKQLVVGTEIVPWTCRARHHLYTHVTLIAVAVALGTTLVGGYRHFLLYRTERQLVDRFVKEVRFFLLDRTRRFERAYPADHLRDELFENQSLPDRAWLCQSVWPKVAAIIKKDSRIVSKVMRVRGNDVVAWEWGASQRRVGDHRERGRSLAKVQEKSGGNGRPVAGRRQKKNSRRSL